MEEKKESQRIRMLELLTNEENNLMLYDALHDKDLTKSRTRLSTLSTRIGDDFLSIRFFKVTFFLTNFLLLAPIISQFGIIAIRQPHSAGQKMCKTHGIAGGGSDCRRKYSRASPKHADG